MTRDNVYKMAQMLNSRDHEMQRLAASIVCPTISIGISSFAHIERAKKIVSLQLKELGIHPIERFRLLWTIEDKNLV